MTENELIDAAGRVIYPKWWDGWKLQSEHGTEAARKSFEEFQHIVRDVIAATGVIRMSRAIERVLRTARTHDTGYYISQDTYDVLRLSFLNHLENVDSDSDEVEPPSNRSEK